MFFFYIYTIVSHEISSGDKNVKTTRVLFQVDALQVAVFSYWFLSQGTNTHG